MHPILTWRVKAPAEKEDFVLDHTDNLDVGENITGSSWDIPVSSGFTTLREAIDGVNCILGLGGGTVGSYIITNTFVTNRLIGSDFRTVVVYVRLEVRSVS
jgi:hypothetical protein